MIRSYFAYGSNMDRIQMAVRCPGAKLIGKAQLREYRFRINSRGVATVVPEPSSSVHGLLWSLSTSDEDLLDRYEGVAKGFYRKADLDVVTDKPECALVYIASDSALGAPRPGYLEKIIAVGQEAGFSEAYLHELRNWSGQRKDGGERI